MTHKWEDPAKAEISIKGSLIKELSDFERLHLTKPEVKPMTTKEMFLRDISNHSMVVLTDDGVSRHLRFSDNGSFNCKFDLVTWAGHLCVTGDCGTYVFSRVPDMFDFFRSDTEGLDIKPSYWGEKLLSICKSGGYEAFDIESFRAILRDQFDDHVAEWIEDDGVAGDRGQFFFDQNDVTVRTLRMMDAFSSQGV